MLFPLFITYSHCVWCVFQSNKTMSILIGISFKTIQCIPRHRSD